LSTDLSEVRAAAIIRAIKSIVLMMEIGRFSETSVDIYLTTRQYIPEDSELHTRRRDNLKSHNAISRLPKSFSFQLCNTLDPIASSDQT
jgi:hypothetical protein